MAMTKEKYEEIQNAMETLCDFCENDFSECDYCMVSHLENDAYTEAMIAGVIEEE